MTQYIIIPGIGAIDGETGQLIIADGALESQEAPPLIPNDAISATVSDQPTLLGVLSPNDAISATVSDQPILGDLPGIDRFFLVFEN